MFPFIWFAVWWDGGQHKTENTMFYLPILPCLYSLRGKITNMFRNYVIMPKVTMFYETQWLLAETCWCSFIPHLSAPLFVFHCPENRLQPAPPAQQGEDEIFLSWTQHFLSSNSGVLAGKLNGENVWILQISILSSHQLDRMKMEPFSGSRFTLVIALRGTHDGKNLWILQIKTWSGETRMEIANICNRS